MTNEHRPLETETRSMPGTVSTVSRILNRIFVGARVVLDQDILSQWESLAIALLVNLMITLVPIVAVAIAIGYYDPLRGKLVQPALYVLLAIANCLGFFLTYMASMQWIMSDAAIERQLQAKRSKFEYRLFLSMLWLGTIALLVIPFISPSFILLIASSTMSSLLLQLIISERSVKTRNDGAR